MPAAGLGLLALAALAACTETQGARHHQQVVHRPGDGEHAHGTTTDAAPEADLSTAQSQVAAANGNPHAATAQAERRWLTSGGWTAAELRTVATHLRDPDPEQREAAVIALSALQPDSLPAISERIAGLHAEMHSAESLSEVVRAWESAPPPPTLDGYRKAAARLLSKRRGDDARALVEALSLLQAFRNLPSIEAGLLLSEWVALYDGVLRPSVDEAVRRDGLARLPALLRLRSHPDPMIKHWAQEHIAGLGIEGPAAALDLQDPGLLADVVTAYSAPLDFGAMPFVVRQTEHRSALVRNAARAAVARYGRNAIWQVREFYEEWTEHSLPQGLTIEQARAGLYAALDRERNTREAERLQRASQQLAAGEHTQAEAEFAAILADWPSDKGAAALVLAEEAVAQRAARDDNLPAAQDALRIALWLTPSDDAAHEQRAASLTFIQAELDLTRAIADTAAYRKVLAVHPEHDGAQAALSQLTNHRRGTRRAFLFVGLSALSLIASGFFLLAWRRTLSPPKGQVRRTVGVRPVSRG